MDNRKVSPRLDRITNELADAAESDIAEAGKSIISVLINDAKTWLMSTYQKWKNSRSLKPQYEELQKYIEASNETVQIGMDKKEIAVMWAMKKLGYTEEQTQEVLDLANKAYLPKEEK